MFEKKGLGHRNSLNPCSLHRKSTVNLLTRQERFRIVVLGAPCVGKTCLVKRLLCEKFQSSYKATVEEMYTEDYLVGNKGMTLDILDTSGHNDFPAMRKLSINMADAFILVYSVDDQASFQEVTKLREQIIEEKGGDQMTPMVIVGNKSDVEERVVHKETAESTVLIDWENGYVEASAKDNLNVASIIRELFKQAQIRIDRGQQILRRRDSAPVVDNQLSSEWYKCHYTSVKRNSCVIS